ncbi:MAG: T9SS type A sorting domain-containing protein [Candidatus Marinimicrobia bacterium]|nr:T9SS type A sorting domain-containing protein [Candidatus Neomarinimicrobiota bacterium]
MSLKKVMLFGLMVLISLSAAFAQEWTPIGPMSSRFYSIEYDADDTNIMYASNKYTFYKSVDAGASWDITYVIDGENFSYMQIWNILNDPFSDSTVYFAANISWNPNLPENGLYRSTDNGESFTQVLSAPIENYTINPTTGRIATWQDGWSGNIKISDDMGMTWSDVPIPEENLFYLAMDAVDDDIMFLTTYNGLHKTTDLGVNWEVIPADSIGEGVDRGRMIVAHPTNSGEYFLGSYSSWNQFFYTTTDTGASWQLVDLPRVNSVSDAPRVMRFGSNPDNIYMAESNEVFMSNDGGVTWRSQSWDINTEFFFSFDLAISSASDDVAIAISEIGAYITTDNGYTWEQYTMISGSTTEMNIAEEADGEYTVYAGNYNGLNVYSSAEATWTDYTDPGTIGAEVKALMTDPAMPGMVMIAKRNAINNGLMYRSTDHGANESLVWHNLDYAGGGFTELVRSLTTPGTMFATTWYEGVASELIKSDDFGESWTVIDGSDNNHHAMTDVVVAYDNDDVIYTFGDGLVVKTEDGGDSWSQVSDDLPSYAGIYDGSISPFSSDMLLVSSDAGTYKSTDGGMSWYLVHDSDCKVVEFNPVLPGIVVMVTFANEVVISYDNGDTWQAFDGNIAADYTDVIYSPDGSTVYISTTSQGIYTTELDLAYVSPSGVTTTVDAFNVTVNWNAVDLASGYHVYRGEELVGVTAADELVYMDYYVLPGTHEYTVVSLFNGVEAGVSLPVFATVDENALAVPADLAFEVQEFRNVALNWGVPTVPPTTEWLQYDDGTQAGTYNSFMGGTYDLAVRYDPADLTELDGSLLTTISFIPVNSGGTHSLKVWTGENGATLAVNEPLSGLIVGEWNDIVLSVPHTIDASVPLYFGFTVEFFGGDAFTYDAGPAIADGKGGSVGMGGSWYSLNDGFYVDANLNMKGMVETVAQRAARNRLNTHMTRELTGYNVYRDGEMIGSSASLEDRSYVDEGLEFGLYHYGVTAATDEGESLPSNIAIVDLKDPYYPPYAVTATKTDIHDVVVTWDTPHFPPANAELRYDSGTNAGSYTSWMGGTSTYAIIYSPEDLADFDGLPLSSIGFIPSNSGATSYTLKVYTCDNGDTEVYSEVLSDISFDEWNDFTPATEYIIDASVTHYFGYELAAWGGIYFTHDEGPAVPDGKGGSVGMGGSWYSLMDGYYIDANINMSIKIEREVINPVVTGYKLFREGEELATFDTTASREYLDAGLDYGVHNYAMTALYGDVETSNPSPLASIELVSPYITPDNLAVAQTDINEVNLSWVAPTFPPVMANLQYDNGTMGGTYSAFSGGTYDVAIKYDAAELTQYVGKSLTSIGFIPVNDLGTYTLKIWTGEDAVNEVLSVPLTDYVLQFWNEFELEEPYIISDTSSLYIGYSVEIFGGNAFSHDAEPAARSGYSDIVRTGGYWYDLTNGFGIVGNVNVFAKIDVTPVPPVMEAYNVYRDNELIYTVENPETTTHYDSDVDFGDHSYAVSVVYELEESETTDPVHIYLQNPYYPPTAFEAEIDEAQSVQLSWAMDTDIYNLHWDNGIYEDAVGVIGGGNIIGAARFSPENLVDADGDILEMIRFYLNDGADVAVKVWTGELAETLVYEQTVSNPLAYGWNEVELTVPVEISSSDWFWIGFEAVGTLDGEYCIGMDEGPAVIGYGDVVSTDDGATWQSLAGFGIDRNVMVQGVVSDNLGGSTLLSLNNTSSGHIFEATTNTLAVAGDTGIRETRETSLMGFNVYRDEVMVATIDDPNARAYTEVDELGDDQTYIYHLTALYTPDVESIASNADTLLTPVAVDDMLIPDEYALKGNYPNPFNPSTTISFELPETQNVKINIFDLRGSLVQTLVNGSMDAGRYNILWNAENQASGVYFYRMEAGSFHATQKMMYLK